MWGSGSASKDTETGSGVPTGPTAQVIEDTMTITKELGLQYLWVDNYCVIQDDPELKMEQIQSMDAVYGRAEVTIIAAAGEDGSFGLPGFSSQPRIPQLFVNFKDQLFVSSGPHLRDLLRLSKWASRGWTYQEGLLSKRRLIFTEYQTYFEYQSSHCCEAIGAPPDVLFQDSPIIDAHPMASRDFRVFPLDKPVAKAHQIMERIQDYASKQLSYQSDALNGILGVLATTEKRKPSITHLWGIPILTQMEKTPLRLELLGSKLDQRTLNPNQALLLELGWSIRPAKRNPGFPSWSWTGWAGPLRLSFSLADLGYVIPATIPKADFWVENHDGLLFDWTEFHNFRHHQEKLFSVSRFLHVEGPAVKLQFNFGKLCENNQEFFQKQDRYGPHLLFQLNEQQISICHLDVTECQDDENSLVDRVLQGTWDALILGHQGLPLPLETDVLGKEVEITFDMLAEKEQTSFELLVLNPVGDSYERLGTIKVVFPLWLKLPSPGLLKITRKRFRIG